jgi:uncharacterized protein HemX
MKRKQAGFAVVPLVIIVVTVLAVAAVGYFVYQRRSAHNDASLNSVEAASATETQLNKDQQNLTTDLDKDTQKLDDVTKEVQ